MAVPAGKGNPARRGFVLIAKMADDDDGVTAALQMGGTTRMQRAPKVKSKQAADRQITAEQLIREAKERQEDEYKAPPRQKIVDAEVSVLRCVGGLISNFAY